MARRAKTIAVTPGSELDRLLAEAGGEDLLLERGGRRYRLVPEQEDIWAGYDPEKAVQALDETAGSWADLDVDRMIDDIYRWREAGSRPMDRP